jgi:hypothetical protein
MHIFKYTLDFQGSEKTTVELPKNSQILEIQEQDSKIRLWDLVDVHEEKEAREFRIIGTGWIINDLEGWRYMKTVKMHNGLVWHIYESMMKKGK